MAKIRLKLKDLRTLVLRAENKFISETVPATFDKTDAVVEISKECSDVFKKYFKFKYNSADYPILKLQDLELHQGSFTEELERACEDFENKIFKMTDEIAQNLIMGEYKTRKEKEDEDEDKEAWDAGLAKSYLVPPSRHFK